MGASAQRGRVGRSALTSEQRQSVVAALAAGADGVTLARAFQVSPTAINYLRRKYLPQPHDFPDVAERQLRQRRFWNRVTIGADDQCWPHESGSLIAYGTCSQASPAGRLPFRNAFYFANGYLPANQLVIRHLCNNKSCCNPAHLRAGTKSENAEDYELFISEAEAGRIGPTEVKDPVAPPPEGWPLDLETPFEELENAAALERLMRGHSVLDSTGCWIYRDRDPNGRRPAVRLRGQSMQPARAVWLIVKRTIPEGAWVLHQCPDGEGGHSANGNCINPEHLYVGTPSDNARDTSSHGRRKAGSKSPNSKLDDDQVRRMRVLRHEGASLNELSKTFGISAASVGRITSDASRYPGAGGPITPRKRTRKLNLEKVSKARRAAADGQPLSGIAAEYGVDVETMREAVTGRSWVDCTILPVLNGTRGLSDEQVRNVRETYDRGGATIDELAGEFGISSRYMESLLSGKERREAGGPLVRMQLTNDQHYAIRVGYQAGRTKPELMDEFGASLNQINDSLAGRTGKGARGPILPPAGRGKRPRGQRPST